MSERPERLPDDLAVLPALRDVAPPAGGLATLRATLDGARPRRRWWLRPALGMGGALVATAAALLVWARVPHATPQVIILEAPRETVVAPAGIPTPSVSVAAQHDPTVSTADVAFYWVSSRPAPARALDHHD